MRAIIGITFMPGILFCASDQAVTVEDKPNTGMFLAVDCAVRPRYCRHLAPSWVLGEGVGDA